MIIWASDLRHIKSARGHGWGSCVGHMASISDKQNRDKNLRENQNRADSNASHEYPGSDDGAFKAQ